jgi:hypothetical protein
MYTAITAFAAVSTIFSPIFIGIYSSSNRNWRSL